MSLTVRADCPACGGEVRVPVTRAASDVRALQCDTDDVQKAYDTHAAEAPELHGGGA